MSTVLVVDRKQLERLLSNDGGDGRYDLSEWSAARKELRAQLDRPAEAEGDRIVNGYVILDGMAFSKVEILEQRKDLCDVLESMAAVDTERCSLQAAISDPEAVFVNMKRGTIAKPSLRSMIDLYGEVVNGEDAQLLEIARLRADRDRLQEEMAELWKRIDNFQSQSHGITALAEIERLRAEVEALRKDAALGSAIQRACCDLPEGFMISVSLEKDAGTLELCLPDTDAVLDDFDGETFADQIHAAIDAAKAAKEA